MTRKVILYCLLLFSFYYGKAQVQWLTFEQLDSALTIKPKPVMVKFTTDWCVYCKKMDQEVFTDLEIIERLSSDYYAVSFDAETEESIQFDGQQYEKSSNERFHSLAMLLAARSGEFAPPVTIFLNESFTVEERSFTYISRKNLLKKLKKYRGN